MRLISYIFACVAFISFPLASFDNLTKKEKLCVLGHMITRAPRPNSAPSLLEEPINREQVKVWTKNLDAEKVYVSQPGSGSKWSISAESEMSFGTLRKTAILKDEVTGNTALTMYESRGDVNGNLLVISTENIQLDGDIYSSGGIENKGNITCDGDLWAKGQGTIDSTLTVGDNATFGQDLSVSGQATISGTCDISGATAIQSDLTISGTADISGNFNVHQNTHFYGQVFFEPENTNQTLIKLNQSNGTEKALIATTDIEGERGLFISVDDGATHHFQITGTGEVVLNNEADAKIELNSFIHENHSKWDIIASSEEEAGIPRRTLYIQDTYNDKTILKIYDHKADVGSVLECNATTLYLTGTGITTLAGGLTITSTAQGYSPVTIQDNNLTITNGYIQATNGYIEEHMGIGTEPNEQYALEVVGSTHQTNNETIEGTLTANGDFELSRQSAIIQEQAPLLHNFGNENIYIGVDAGTVSFITLGAVGSNNTGVGTGALYDLEDGNGNTALGDRALSKLYDGNYNVAIGRNAGSAYTEFESNNICIGNDTDGTQGENNTVRIGDGIEKVYIDGIYTSDLGDSAYIVGITDQKNLGTNATTFVLNGALTTPETITTDGSMLHSEINITGTAEKLYSPGTPNCTNRILYGYYSSAQDQILDNTNGIAAAKADLGECYVSFTPAFSSVPNVVVTPSSVTPALATIKILGTNGCVISTWDVAGNPTDMDISISVIGPH